VEGDGTATATAKLHTMRLYVLSTQYRYLACR
jgi:hypothetical protein